MSRRSRILLSLTIALTWSLVVAPGSARAQRAITPPTPASAGQEAAQDSAAQDSAAVQDTVAVAPPDTLATLGLAIAPSDIPRRAEETMVEIRDMRSRLQPEQELSARAREVQDLLFLLGRRRADFERILVDDISSRALDDMRQEWLAFQLQLSNWQGRLVAQAEAIVAERQRLREVEEVWSETLQSADRLDMPPALAQRSESVLVALQSLTSQVRFERDVVLTLQDQISEEILAVSEVLQEVDRARERRIGGLLAADAPPLWLALRTQRDSVSAAAQVAATLREDITHLRLYLDRTEVTYGRPGHWVQIGFFLALALLLSWFRYLSRGWTYDDEELRASARILGRPFSAALLLVLLFTRDIYPTAPVALFELNRLLILVPVLRLIPWSAMAKYRSAIYVTLVLFVLDWSRNLIFPDSLLNRIVLFAWTIVAFVAFAWVVRPKGALAGVGGGFWPRTALFLGRVVALAFLAAALANLFGFVHLASYVSNSALAAAYSAIVLYAGYLVLAGAWRAILRAKLATSLKAIQVHTATAERRGVRLLRVVAILVWILAVASFLGVAETLVDAVSAALSAGVEVGTVTISVGGVLAFVITIWLAIIVSGILRALLAEDVFPKTRHARAADTISTLVYWTVLLVGFLFAAAAAGFEIGRLTLLAGAFGVGIGFGLQDVVNNFVSGLILAFERPIQVGDIIDLGTLQGTVSRIGMRSSVIRTFQGADVVVPNSNLISNQMINWTRSDRLRRVEIPVGVAYGTDQRVVFDVLATVAREHPDVLDHPEPTVLLRGFGDSSLNFELRFWTYRFDGFLRIQSEVTRVILDALKEAGITIPFPQRDLHVKSVAPGVREPVPELELPTFSDPGDA